MPGQDNNPSANIPPEFLKGLKDYPHIPEEAFELKQKRSELNEFVKNDQKPDPLSSEEYAQEFDKMMKGEPSRLANLGEMMKSNDSEIELFIKTSHRELIKEENLIEEITALMREADQKFESIGGGTRHYVRDILLPLMEEKGLCFCRVIK